MPEYKAIERDQRNENRENQYACRDNQNFLHDEYWISLSTSGPLHS